MPARRGPHPPHPPPKSHPSPIPAPPNHTDVTLLWSGAHRCDIAVVRPGGPEARRPGGQGPGSPGPRRPARPPRPRPPGPVGCGNMNALGRLRRGMRKPDAQQPCRNLIPRPRVDQADRRTRALRPHQGEVNRQDPVRERPRTRTQHQRKHQQPVVVHQVRRHQRQPACRRLTWPQSTYIPHRQRRGSLTRISADAPVATRSIQAVPRSSGGTMASQSRTSAESSP